MSYVTRTARRLKRWQHGALSVILGLSLAAFGLTSSASAATTQMYFNPAWFHINAGQTLTATLRINPGTPIDAVEATLQYSPTRLQYLSVDSTGSGFPIELPTQTTKSSVTITRGIFGSTVNKDVLVARINFKVLNPTGYTLVTLVGNATYNGAYTNPTTSNLPIRVYAP